MTVAEPLISRPILTHTRRPLDARDTPRGAGSLRRSIIMGKNFKAAFDILVLLLYIPVEKHYFRRGFE